MEIDENKYIKILIRKHAVSSFDFESAICFLARGELPYKREWVGVLVRNLEVLILKQHIN